MVTAACLALTTGAVPAKRGVVTTLTAPDGSTVSATLAGDEYAHYYIGEADNTIYTLDTRGLAVATTPDDIAQLRQRNLATRHPAQAKAPQARIGMSDRLSDYCIESLGDQRIPVILVDYRDLAFTHGDDARATFTDFFQEGEKSARQYMLDNSNGRFRPQFDIYGPYHLSKNMSYYGGNDDYGNDKAVGEMVAEACQLATEVDFSQYDNNGDGYCDAVIVIYAGNGEAQSGKKSSVWPCQWSLTESEYNKTLTLNGVKIDKFAVFNELNGSSSTKIDGIGTFAHEFSHVLGLPDYYSTNPYASYFGMGSWSLMDYGCYADNGYTPAGYTAYDKMTLGWIDDIPEPEPASHLTLTPMNQGSAETDQAYRLIGENENEYYVLENRARIKWDQHLPAEGLLIYHVNYNKRRWDYNTVNAQNPLCMALVAADNARSTFTESTDLFPLNSVDAFTDTSTPAATLYTGGKLGKPVVNITRNATTGIVECDIAPDAVIPMPSPEFNGNNTPAPDDLEITDRSFTAKWDAVDTDIKFTYTLEVTPQSDNTPQTKAESTDNTDTGGETMLFEKLTTNSHTVSGLTYGMKYNWRVRTVPDSPYAASPGEWSQTQTVEINGQSAITQVGADAGTDTPAVYYDLTGRRVDNPGPGIYIARRGRNIEKVTVR